MGLADSALNATHRRDDVNAGSTFYDATECDVTAIGRPDWIKVDCGLLRQAYRVLGSDKLHIQTEVRSGPAVPGKGQMLAIRRKTWGMLFANVSDDRGDCRRSRDGSMRMSVVKKRRDDSTRRQSA